jgi:uncharacterized protein (DUF305 family)
LLIMVRARAPFIVFLVFAATAACRSAPAHGTKTAPGASEPKPPIVQPGAPGQASKVITAEQAADLSQVQYTGDDIKFMQGMIGHHAQAIQMVALVPTRTHSEDLKKLALRIDVSQQDEIKMMESWLRARGQQVPGPGVHRMNGAPTMPGMLTPEEMERLAAANGAEFDRLFLQGMIKHHGGALTMVSDLLAAPGAAQESEVFAFVSDVEADQRMEIDRMGAMLNHMKE